MPVVESVLRESVNVRLNAGVNPSGGMVTRSVSIGKIVTSANADKIFEIAEALTPVLSLSPVRVERTKVTLLEAD